mmetsp:Transcript_12380/g.35058  ORF Transcript_12380/g.35058 Transcript_12380/m.35058 type:complete len:321 (-) Transcript_12380:126-1088(-)
MPDADAAAAGCAAAKRPRTDGVMVPSGLCSFYNVEDWYREHKADFEPPVCNRLMHKGQLVIMFVGGPNERTDFHLEEGDEFFFQMRGDMELVTVQQDQRENVQIKSGHVFCLPSRIPHSPQRKVPGSFGLVVERRREEGEMDGLIYYTDFGKCDKVQWERFFPCTDLKKDLPPVIGAYKAFMASDESARELQWPDEDRPVRQDRSSRVPAPFALDDFLSKHSEELARGALLPLFGPDQPRSELLASVAGGPGEQHAEGSPHETWLYQIRGAAYVTVPSGTLKLSEGCCCIVEPGVGYEVCRAAGSAGLVLQMDPAAAKGK